MKKMNINSTSKTLLTRSKKVKQILLHSLPIYNIKYQISNIKYQISNTDTILCIGHIN